LGVLATAVVVASMAATWLALDVLSAGSDFRAEEPLARPPVVVAETQPARAAAIASPAPAPLPVDERRAVDVIVATKAPQIGAEPAPVAAPSVAPPPVAAAPVIAPPPPMAPRTASATPDTATPVTAPLPPIAPRVALHPTDVPRIASLPTDAVTPSFVPLPPRRPPGPLGGVESTSMRPADAVRPEAARADTAQPSRESVHPPSGGEAKIQRTVASAPAAAAPPQEDNRNIFERIFGGLGQPSAPAAGGGTAVYDIAAHTVYMPNGEKLEAHSGLGSNFDDPSTVSQKNRGVTPPQTYALELRKQLFHGVAALRLNPVGDGNMYGRVGMLAHSYMLGPRGDSNGCLSFKDYRKFLEAYQRGEVSRLVVVARGGAAPASVASVRD
jgi:hypothetical protein